MGLSKDASKTWALSPWMPSRVALPRLVTDTAGQSWRSLWLHPEEVVEPSPRQLEPAS